MNTFTLENIEHLTQRTLSNGSWEIGFDSGNQGLCHQLYVDAELRDWTESPGQRRFLLQNTSQWQDVVIAAVSAEDRVTDFSALLPAACRSPGVTFRQWATPAFGANNGRFVLRDDHAGQSPPSDVAVADCRRACQGLFGLGQYAFGLGGFGYGGTGAAGMGNGNFAIGRFGFDVLAVLLEAQLRDEGLHHVALGIVRDDGQEAFLPAQTVLVLVPPPPATEIETIHYDPLTHTLTLHIE